MTTPVRQGGRTVLPTGEVAIWSVAEGRRGTRWREVLTQGDAVLRALLLEVDPAGRLMRLEIATAAGLLTLHPEPDDSAIHGNVVTADGIRHLSFGWGPGHRLLVAASPVVAAMLGRAATFDAARPGEAIVDLLVIDDALVPAAVQRPLSSDDLDLAEALAAGRAWAMEI